MTSNEEILQEIGKATIHTFLRYVDSLNKDVAALEKGGKKVGTITAYNIGQYGNDLITLEGIFSRANSTCKELGLHFPKGDGNDWSDFTALSNLIHAQATSVPSTQYNTSTPTKECTCACNSNRDSNTGESQDSCEGQLSLGG